MKIRLFALSVLLLLLPGCLAASERERLPTPDCGNNEYWDGHQCRYNFKTNRH